MNREEAMAIQIRALGAIRELNSIVGLDMDWTGDSALSQLRRAIGALIWQIDAEVLTVLYRNFPDMNDLKDLDAKMFDRLFDD